jgi:hypothetical protein
MMGAGSLLSWFKETASWLLQLVDFRVVQTPLVADPSVSEIEYNAVETEIFGQYYFREMLLDQLERYFVYIRRMRFRDPEAFKLYSRVGALLLPWRGHCGKDELLRQTDNRYAWGAPLEPEPLREKRKLSPWWKKNRPSFGYIGWGTDSNTEKLERSGDEGKALCYHPKFLYFQKLEKPHPHVERRSGGVTYGVTVYWDRPDSKQMRKGGVPQEYHVFIHDDGNVSVLRQQELSRQTVRAKRGRERGKPSPSRSARGKFRSAMRAGRHRTTRRSISICVICFSM